MGQALVCMQWRMKVAGCLLGSFTLLSDSHSGWLSGLEQIKVDL